MNKISAVGIKKLWYFGDQSVKAENLASAAALKTFLGGEGVDEVKNIHQDTWTLEESEPSQDSYKNQLTKQIYRMGSKDMGEITANWTIGQYDYALKKVFLGGEIIGTEAAPTGWKRARGVVEVYKGLAALTEDDQYVVFPHCSIAANEANTDGAIGLAIKGTVMEPEDDALCSEYWFDGILTA